MSPNAHPLESDENLLVRLNEGNSQAFSQIYEKFWKRLYLSAFSILRDSQACEDIVQDIFVQLWMNRENQSISSLRSYLHSAIRYQVFKVIRSGGIYEGLWQEILHTTQRSEIEDLLEEKELALRLEHAIQRLPPKCRQVFVMSRMQAMSIKQIAEKLHVSTRTIENHLSYALRHLRVEFGDLLFWGLIGLEYFLID